MIIILLNYYNFHQIKVKKIYNSIVNYWIIDQEFVNFLKSSIMENQEIALFENNGIGNDQSQKAYKIIIIQLEKKYPGIIQNFDTLVLLA